LPYTNPRSQQLLSRRFGHHRRNVDRWSVRLTLLLRTLILAGYPLAAMLATVAGTQTAAFTYPFRGLVLGLAIAVLALSFARRQRTRFDSLLVCFLLAYLARLLYDWQIADNPHAEDALFKFLVLVFFPILASMSAADLSIHERALAKGCLALALISLFSAFVLQRLGLSYNPWADAGVEINRLWFEALNPISLGHLAGLACLSALFLSFEAKEEPGWLKILSIAALSFAILMLLYANSRGPILAAAVAMICHFLFRFKRMAFLVPVVLILPIFVATDNFLIAQVVDRFRVNESEIDLSAEGRVLATRAAIEAFIEHPLLGAHFLDPDTAAGNYPHNITIETAMALGVLGIGFLLTMLVRAGGKILAFYNRQHPLLTMLLIQQFVATSLSGAVWGNDAFFLLLAMCLMAKPRQRSQPKEALI
jgi:hypothetical protein